jgi:hypothetical protein
MVVEEEEDTDAVKYNIHICIMGNYFADQYSLLHFSVGVLSYYWNIPFLLAIVVHILFEIIENTNQGMSFINTLFVGKGLLTWPGGKDKPDELINIIGDNVFFALGWIVSQILDVLGSKYGWYVRHIQ